MQFPHGLENSPFTQEVVVIDPIIFKIGYSVCSCQSQKYHFIPLFIKAGSWQKIFFCSVLKSSLYMFNVFFQKIFPSARQEFSHQHIYFILHIYLVHQIIQWPLRNFYTFYHLQEYNFRMGRGFQVWKFHLKISPSHIFFRIRRNT